MSSHHLLSTLSTESVVEFLADREGLAGAKRDRFRHLLHEYGGFREASPPRYSRPLIIIAVVLALSGLALDRPSGWTDNLVWVVYLFVAAGLTWRLSREESEVGHFDRETDWQAYCLFLRPVILNDHPGLLDRNAKSAGQESTQSMLRPVPLIRALMHERGPDLWVSVMLGLWGGMATMLVAHLTVTITNLFLSLAFPAAGLLLGLVVWMLSRRLIYTVAKSDSLRVEP